MEDQETRALLLQNLAELASPSYTARAARLCTNAQLRRAINGAIAQLEWYNACGFEDESKSPGGASKDALKKYLARFVIARPR